ncbi:MAG: hypothetical protein ABI476_08700, partial [Oxalobacteraceae bacterium]
RQPSFLIHFLQHTNGCVPSGFNIKGFNVKNSVNATAEVIKLTLESQSHSGLNNYAGACINC